MNTLHYYTTRTQLNIDFTRVLCLLFTIKAIEDITSGLDSNNTIINYYLLIYMII